MKHFVWKKIALFLAISILFGQISIAATDFRLFSSNEKPELSEFSEIRELENSVKKYTNYVLTLQSENGTWQSPLITTIASGAAATLFTIQSLGLLEKDEEWKNIFIGLIKGILKQQNSDGGFPVSPSFRGARHNTNFILYVLEASKQSLQEDNFFLSNENLIPEVEKSIKKAKLFLRNYSLKGPDTITQLPVLTLFKTLSKPNNFWGIVGSILDPNLACRIFDTKKFQKIEKEYNVIFTELLPAISLYLDYFTQNSFFGQKIYSLKCKINPSYKEKKELAVSEIVDHIKSIQDPNGGWYYDSIHTSLYLLALKSSGLPLEDTSIKKGLEYLKSLFYEDEGSLRQQFLASDIWDTAAVGLELQDYGLSSKDKPLESAVNVLLDGQVETGGWAFATGSNLADRDTTSMPFLFLHRAKKEASSEQKEKISKAISRALLLYEKKQNKDGGWSAFRPTNFLSGKGNPGVLKSLVIDSSFQDVAGRILYALGDTGLTIKNSKMVKRAVNYFWATQTEAGSWWSRWTIGYITGTAYALLGLSKVGLTPENDKIKKGVNFLIKNQNEDGGWGESYLADKDTSKAGIGKSTPFQTALVISALLNLYGKKIVSEENIKDAIIYLINSQNDEGLFLDPYPVCTVIPGSVYYHYPIYTGSIVARTLIHYFQLVKK